MYKLFVILFFCVICSLSPEAGSARILAVFPMPAISHQLVFKALTQELGKRHEIVVIIPNTELPTETQDNITNIYTGYSYELLRTSLDSNRDFKKQRGIISNMDIVLNLYAKAMISVISPVFEHPEVIKLIEDKEQKFDLVITEPIMNLLLIFTKIFNTQAILFSSFYGLAENFEAMGAISRHPKLYPNIYRNKYNNLTFLEKLQQIYYEFLLYDMVLKSEEIENDLLRNKFGPTAPTVSELKDNVAMAFLNTHQIMDNNRPVPPGVVYLGALHLQPVKELPGDLKAFLNNSTLGVVYVSLGTNVDPSLMDREFVDTFVDGIDALPYDVLWKFDSIHLDRVPKNALVQKWFPQRDLLMHPNIQVFVTQGGLQSTDEAIDAAVPLVGIPMLGDQWYNVNKYVELGIGLEIDALTMTADDLVKSVKGVAENDSYKCNIKRLRSIINDQPQRPLERAVWWTEHVLRHGGARHLRAPAANMSWKEYFMTDVLVPVALAVFALVFTINLIVFYVVRNILRIFRLDIKVKQSLE